MGSGVDGNCPATDRRGFARQADGDGDTVAACDRGAYERGAVSPEPLIFADGFESPMPMP